MSVSKNVFVMINILQSESISVLRYLTLTRRSLPTISPSFRHPLMLDLSKTSQSFFTTGSLNKLIFVDLSKESDMAARKTRSPYTAFYQTEDSRNTLENNWLQDKSLLPGRNGKSDTDTPTAPSWFLPPTQMWAAFAKGCVYVKMVRCRQICLDVFCCIYLF